MSERCENTFCLGSANCALLNLDITLKQARDGLTMLEAAQKRCALTKAANNLLDKGAEIIKQSEGKKG